MASATACTLRVINSSEIILNLDCSLGTGLLTLHTADTAVGACLTCNSALIVAGALNNDSAGLGEHVNNALRTGLSTEAATDTSNGINLGNAILGGNAALAFQNLQDMKNRRIDAAIIFGSVFRLFSDLYTVALLREAGLAPDAIAKRAGIHEYKTKLYLRAIGRRTAESLGLTLEKCRRLDLAGKSGTADYSGLERLIAEEARV